MLKYKEVKVISCHNWDNLVEETYGKIYCFQQQEGCQERGVVNITIPNQDYVEEYPDEIPFQINGDEMGVSLETWLKTTKEEINRKYPESYPGANNLWWERNFYPGLQVIANDLYSKGLIEKGDYSINIDW